MLIFGTDLKIRGFCFKVAGPESQNESVEVIKQEHKNKGPCMMNIDDEISAQRQKVNLATLVSTLGPRPPSAFCNLRTIKKQRLFTFWNRSWSWGEYFLNKLDLAFRGYIGFWLNHLSLTFLIWFPELQNATKIWAFVMLDKILIWWFWFDVTI